MNKVYTAQEVADKLKIKKSTVYDLIKRGELSSSKVGKQLRVSEEQLSQYLKGSECSASSAQSYDHQPESSLLKRDYLLHSSGLIISGQASPALDLLLNQRIWDLSFPFFFGVARLSPRLAGFYEKALYPHYAPILCMYHGPSDLYVHANVQQ